MPKFATLTICSTWAAAGGVPIRDIPRHALADCRATLTVENPDQNRLEGSVRRKWDGLGELTARRVLRVGFTDGTFDEWRLHTSTPATLGSGLKPFSCLPPVYMLAECGEYYTTGAGGLRDYSYSLSSTTASQAFTTLVLGTPGIPAFVGLGTVDAAIDAVEIDVESTDEGRTPLAIVLQIRDAVRKKGVACEWQYRRVGTSSYVVDFVTQVGDEAAVPEFAAGKNLINYLLGYDCTRQTTRVRTTGPVDATGLAARMSRARFAVTAVNGGTKRLVLADEAGGPGPIQFDEQYVGWFAFRERTGRTYQILHSYASTQEIELADVSTMAAHSVTAPEWISFRETEPLTGTRRWLGNAGYLMGALEVTAVAGATLTCAGSWGADAFDVDGRFIDWYLRRATFVLATSGTSAVSASRLDVLSVTGVQAGDVVVPGSAATPSYGFAGPTMVVASVDTVNKRLTVTSRDGADLILSGTTRYFRIYRPVAQLHLIRGSTASTNVVTVDAVGTAAVNDLVEVVQPCGGVLPTWVESPAHVAESGVKVSVLSVDAGGECNVVPNPVMRAWSGSASTPPDGWTWTGTGGATITRLTDPAFAIESDYAALCILNTSTNVSGGLRSPPAFLHQVAGADTYSVRFRFQITDFPPGWEYDPGIDDMVPVQSTITVQVFRRLPNGTLLAGPYLVFGSPTGALTGDGSFPRTQLNTWLDAVFPALSAPLTDETLVVAIGAYMWGTTPGGDIKAVVAGVQITQTPTAPREIPQRLLEYSGGTTHLQRANAELRAWAPLPTVITAKIADFARVDPDRHAADEVTLGGAIRLTHQDEGVDQTVRCLSLAVNYLDDADTGVTVAALPPRLTSLVALGSPAA
jgi:hypothetical protein